MKLRLWILREQLRKLFSFQKDMTIFEHRDNYERFVGKFPCAKDISIVVDDSAGHKARWLRPKSSHCPKTVLYLHGGSMCMGSIESHTPIATQLAHKTCATVYLPEYRLSPENPFPNAIDDAIEAYTYLLSQGIKSSDIALCSDSAGALLLLNILFHAKEKELPLPSCAAMLAPAVCLDMVENKELYQDLDDRDPILSIRDMWRCSHAYLGKADPEDPRVSPLYNDFHQLPPLMSVLGSEEMILEQVRQMHIKCHKSKVINRMIVQPGCFHGHYFLYSLLPEGNEALNHICDFMKKYLNSPSDEDSNTDG